jgi:putative oxidoreductase
MSAAIGGVPVTIIARESMPADFASTLIFIARLLIGGAFIFAGLRNMTNVPALTGLMAGRGVPQARVVLLAGIVLQVVAGALLITGPWIAFAAAALIVFVVTATPIFHNFWDHQGLDRGSRINGIVSNVAWVGGLLLVIATAP